MKEIIIYQSNNPIRIYKFALKSLFKNKFRIKGDKKICRESKGVFYIPYYKKESVVNISKNNFIPNFNYDLIRKKGNKQMITESKYYSKMFLKNKKLQKVISLLKKDRSNKKAIISLNLPSRLLNDKLPPCMMYIAFRIINKKLNLSCHMRVNNAYGIFLMNLHINQALHIYASKLLKLKVGNYCHFVDSLHIYKKEEKEVKKFNIKLTTIK